MTALIEVSHLTKTYRELTAVNDVSFGIQEHAIVGLLGRNGAGKSTLMSMIACHTPATSGSIRIFGEDPWENAATLSRICSVRESQQYPPDWKVRHALDVAASAFPQWDAAFADDLVERFELPVGRKILKLSRGQWSAVGIIIGLASRTEVTLFDEPYLGLDAVMRQRFYDALLADYAEHPRTVILSSHLIDEIADLLEHVLVIDKGVLVMDASADDLRGSAVVLTGDTKVIDAALGARTVIHRESLGRVTSATVEGIFTTGERADLTSRGVEFSPLSLQQLIVRKTDGTISEGELS